MAAAAASIRELKRRLLPYFVLAFSFTWARWWLVVLEGRDIFELPPSAAFLGAFGPRARVLGLTPEWR